MSFVSQPSGPQARIEISIPDNLLLVDNFEEELESTIVDIAREARDFWETTAGQRLTSARERYQEAIGMEQQAGNEITLLLTSDFANQVENGSQGYDMKPGFMRSPKLKTGPVKMPRAVAASLPRTGQPRATKWMVIPLNVNREVRMGSPQFRTFTDKQPSSMWMHPGFKGVHIADDVVTELQDKIVPRHIEDLIDRLYGGF